MNTPAQCGVIKPPKTDIYSEAPQESFPAGESGFVTIESAPGYACAARDDGSHACWSKAGISEYWLAEEIDIFESYGDFRVGSLGPSYACAIDEAGDVPCWWIFDFDDFRQAWFTKRDFVSVDVAHPFACGVRSDGEVQCWGGRSTVLCVGGQGCPCDLDRGGKLACQAPWARLASCWHPSNDPANWCWEFYCMMGGCWGWGIDEAPEGPFRAISVAPGWAYQPVPICAVRVDGSLACWNSGRYSSQPPGGSFRALDAGRDFFCGVRAGGVLACWGAGSAGWALPAGTFVSVSAGAYHACGLRADGEAACWGADTAGETSPPPGPFATIAAGDAVTCALRPSGEATCWGSNPWWVAAPPEGRFEALSVGSEAACGLRPDRSVECWGRLAESPQPHGEFVSVYLGLEDPGAACGLRPGGRIECWGHSPPERSAPPTAINERGERVQVAFASLAGTAEYLCGLDADDAAVCWHERFDWWDESPPGSFSAVAASRFDACGIRPGGEVECWSPIWPSWMEFPPSPPRNAVQRPGAPKELWWVADGAPPGPFTAIDSGGTITCGIRADATAQCWGGQVTAEPFPPPPGAFTSISQGDRVACGLRPDRDLYCWSTAFGSSHSPVRVSGPFEELDFGAKYAYGIRPDGTVACWWGSADSLCDPPPGRFTKLDTGWGPIDSSREYYPEEHHHTCGIRPDGAVDCWGSNLHGESVPPPHTDDAVYIDIAAGFLHTCALDAAGEALCWGDGTYGQTNTPNGPFTAISAGQWHTCGLRPDGEITCWGNGPAPATQKYDKPHDIYPTQPPTGPFTAISAGQWHTCALRPDGDVNCWLSY